MVGALSDAPRGTIFGTNFLFIFENSGAGVRETEPDLARERMSLMSWRDATESFRLLRCNSDSAAAVVLLNSPRSAFEPLNGRRSFWDRLRKREWFE